MTSAKEALNMGELLKETINKIKPLQKTEKNLKIALRELMKENNYGELIGDNVTIQYIKTEFIEPHNLKQTHLEAFEKFVHEKHTLVIDKEGLKKMFPETYKKCVEEGTARIKVK